MQGWRLLIVAASAVAALAVGLGAQAGPPPSDDLELPALPSLELPG